MSYRLLVAEDNVATAQIEKFALEQAGYDVTTAANGSEAWDQLAESEFDLVLADEQMPRMTGRELRRHMCSHEELAKIPFILLTAKRWEIER
ncbi:MAG: response regulator, partial [Planctomycetota bacterium]